MRMFVFDIDGTLLTSDHDILPSTIHSVERLAQQGDRVVLASARPPRSIRIILGNLPLTEEFYIALNGSLVFAEEVPVWGKDVEKRAAGRIIEEARSHRLHVNLYTEDDWFVESDSAYINQEARIVEYEPTRVNDLLKVLEHSTYKLLIMGPEDRIGMFQNWIQDQDISVSATRSKLTYCEVVRRGVSKAGALDRLLDQWDERFDSIVAFGDGENDVELLRRADRGVAMGNGSESLKQVANYVTRSSDDHGIRHALMELGYLA